MAYLTALNHGGEVSDIDTGFLIAPQRFFKWQFPKLDLRFVNNSSKTIFITNVILDVEESILDPSPVIILPKQEPNIFHFALLNVGWGSIQDALIRFNLIPWGQNFSFDGYYPYDMTLNAYFDEKNSQWYGCEYYNVDVSEALQKCGVKIQAFGERDPNDFTNRFNANFPRMRFFQDFLYGNNVNPEEYQGWAREQLERFLNLLDALGSFKHGKNYNDVEHYGGRYSALAYGELHFKSMSLSGNSEEKIVKFSTEIPLLISGMYGAGAHSSYQYDAKLDVDRKKYEIVVKGKGSSVSQYLKAGDVDRFHIIIGAEKSSIHTFRMKFIYNNNKVLTSPKMELSIFVPKIESKNIQERNYTS